MKADITVILDKSGSMHERRGDAIGGFNQLLDDQQKQPGEAKFSLIQFDTSYQINYTEREIADAPRLTDETYVPGGSTALLDAIGKTIDAVGMRLKAMPEADRPGKVIIVIITDGLENSSRQFSREQIHEKITHQTDVYKWQFIFIGANQDAVASAAKVGIPVDNAVEYGFSPAGVRASYAVASASMGRVRAGKRAAFTHAERAQAMAGEKPFRTPPKPQPPKMRTVREGEVPKSEK